MELDPTLSRLRATCEARLLQAEQDLSRFATGQEVLLRRWNDPRAEDYLGRHHLGMTALGGALTRDLHSSLEGVDRLGQALKRTIESLQEAARDNAEALAAAARSAQAGQSALELARSALAAAEDVRAQTSHLHEGLRALGRPPI